ncbi:MAG: AsnC family transcriptional regulator [Deltaproteobacteria bacterium RBG_13_53_10]|nr:MAG: AsnC family transcriptional regulator [Deltaproteobacteria bacterium RBG_13_53_10]
MKISTKIRYGIRAVLELSYHYGTGPIDLREIAKREGISLKYLEQVIIPLRAAGFVKSIRGSKGGYVLAKSPAEILVGDVIEILEGPINLIECLKDPGACQRSSTCVSREVWAEVSEAICKVINSVTLEQMVNRRKEKEGLAPSMYQI